MSAKYSASERAAAVRCVDCPSCGAQKGEKCHYIGFPASASSEIPAHKRRVDNYYIDMGQFMSRNCEVLRGGSGSE